MPLYLVQDPDRPLYVIADSWERAIGAWQRVVREENAPDESDEEYGELDSPSGVQLIGDDSEIVVEGKLRKPLASETQTEDRKAAESPDVSNRLNQFQAGVVLCDTEGRHVTGLWASESGQELMAEFEHDNAEAYLVTPDELQPQVKAATG